MAALAAVSPSSPRAEEVWELPFDRLHVQILSYLPSIGDAEGAHVSVIASLFWNLMGEWNKARLSSTIQPHQRVFQHIEDRQDFFRLSKCAIFALILQKRMLQTKTASIKNFRSYEKLTEDIFSSRKIEHLKLPGCEDKEAWRIVSKYPHIKRLDLSHAMKVRDCGFLWKLGMHCRNLQELDLSHCQLRGADMRVRMKRGRCSFRSLTLIEVGGIKESGLQYLIRSSPYLERLHLRVSGPVAELHNVLFICWIVQEVARHCREIRELILPFDCSDSDDQDVMELVRNYRELGLVCSRRRTDTQLTYLPVANPNSSLEEKNPEMAKYVRSLL